jgi:hypothetical protein
MIDKTEKDKDKIDPQYIFKQYEYCTDIPLWQVRQTSRFHEGCKKWCNGAFLRTIECYDVGTFMCGYKNHMTKYRQDYRMGRCFYDYDDAAFKRTNLDHVRNSAIVFLSFAVLLILTSLWYFAIYFGIYYVNKFEHYNNEIEFDYYSNSQSNSDLTEIDQI